jgi:methyl coenzyme M reductase beta subunit
MHPLTTNILGLTFDVYRFAFESAGALEIANEYSGLALIELGDHLDHAITPGVELPRQEGEFIAEFFIFTDSIRGGGSSGMGHGGTYTTVVISSNIFYACKLSCATVLDLFYRYFSLISV